MSSCQQRASSLLKWCHASYHTLPALLFVPTCSLLPRFRIPALPAHRYTNTSAVISRISYIDGEKGILRYRGYPIEELAAKSTFMETSYLVLFGSLPTQVGE